MPYLRDEKKNRTGALSTTEAEYVAQCDSAGDAVGHRNAMERVRYRQDLATTLAHDSTAAIVWAREGADARGTKHIVFKVHYMHEQVENRLLKLKYVPSKELLADIMAKLLATPELEQQRERLGLRERTDGSSQEEGRNSGQARN